MAFALWASAIVAFANIAMTLVLLGLYTGTYRKIKSSFTMGLLLFGTFFVLLNLAILVFWLFLFQNFGSAQLGSFVEQASLYMFFVNLGEALALANLLRVTWK